MLSNNQLKQSWLTRLATIAGAALLVLSGTPIAYADDAIGTPPTQAVDPGRLGSLSVHKFVQPEQIGDVGDGTQQDTSGLEPIADIGFTARLIDREKLDLATNDGWLTLASLEGDVAEISGLGFDPNQPAAAEQRTNAEGLARFGDLPVGAYVVTETFSNGYTPAMPFVVTVPMTDPGARDAWMYDIHVYPKNSQGNNKRVVDRDAVVMGDPVTWTVRADIPRGGPIDGYQIADPLDQRLDYAGATVSFTGVDTAAYPGLALEASADFNIDYVDNERHPRFHKYKYPSSTVIVDFTATGLEKLQRAAGLTGTAQVEVEITTTVRWLIRDGQWDDGILNWGYIYPSREAVEWLPNPGPGRLSSDDPGVQTNMVETQWGAIQFVKTAGADEDFRPLQGAVFQLYLNEDDALTRHNPVAISRAIDGSDLAQPQFDFVSDEQGVVSIPGLRSSRWADGEEAFRGSADSDTDRSRGYQPYWLVETRAPEGYTLLAEPIEVEVTDLFSVKVVSGMPQDDGNDGMLERVVNVPNGAGFELPKTGGWGLWLLGSGSVLFALGAGLMILRRNRNRALER